MHKLTILLLMAALTATASKPKKMFVVIHTTDKVIVNYVCAEESENTADVPVLGSCIKSTGGYMWHVVGGVAPYTVLKNELRTMTSGCITVMDAEGTIATSCGVIGVLQEKLAVDCYAKKDLDDGPYGLVPNDSTDAARVGWKTPPVEHDPGDTYVPPVRGPIPTVDPPVDPDPITTKPEGRTPRTSKGPGNPPPVNHKAVLPPAKNPLEGSGQGPKSLGNKPGRLSSDQCDQPNRTKALKDR